MNQAPEGKKNKARTELGSIHEKSKPEERETKQKQKKKARRKGESAKEKNKTLSHLFCALFFSSASLIFSALSLFS